MCGMTPVMEEDGGGGGVWYIKIAIWMEWLGERTRTSVDSQECAPPPAMVALMRESNSSSPLMASCK